MQNSAFVFSEIQTKSVYKYAFLLDLVWPHYVSKIKYNKESRLIKQKYSNQTLISEMLEGHVQDVLLVVQHCLLKGATKADEHNTFWYHYSDLCDGSFYVLNKYNLSSNSLRF